MKRAIALPTLALALVVAGPGMAQVTTRVSVVDTLGLEYRADNGNDRDDDDNYGALINRLNLTGNAGEISVVARVDTFAFAEAPDDRYKHVVSPERLLVSWSRAGWRVDLGDVYEQLGRGFVLSMRKIDENGVDVATRGGALEFDSDVFDFRLFAGVSNPVNVEPTTQRFLRDTNDIVAGGRVDLRPIRQLGISMFGAMVQPEVTELQQLPDFLRPDGDDVKVDRTGSVGIGLDVPSLTDWLSLYAEADWQRRDVFDQESDGIAAYGTANLSFGGTAVLLEGLYLDDWIVEGSPNEGLREGGGEPERFRYYQPPTLERNDQEVFNSSDVRGGRVRWEHWFMGPDLTVHANFLYRGTPDPEGTADVRALHAYAGLEGYYQQGSSRYGVSGGWRDEDTPEGETTDLKSMVHYEVDWVQAAGGGWSTHVTSNTEFRTLGDDHYVRGSTFAGVERRGLGALTFEFGYDTQNQSGDIANFFYAGIAKWEINDHFTLGAIGGTQRGGLKCVNGVCREYPPFAGGRLELVTRF